MNPASSFPLTAILTGLAVVLPAQAAPQFTMPSGVVHVDRPSADIDTVWIRGDAYKAAIARDVVTFIPFLGGGAPRNQPLRLSLESVRCGDRHIDAVAATVTAEGTRVTVRRRGFTELYDGRPEGLEQSFRFDRLDGTTGDLTITLAANGEAVPAADGPDVVFRGPLGNVRYSGLVAFDAVGRRLSLPIGVDRDRLRLTVPGEFVAQAVLPLTVDPVLTSTTTVSPTADQRMEPDIAWNEDAGEHLVIWRVPFSATDWDVAAIRTDFWMNPIGASFWIDFTSAHWESSRVACKRLEGMFLVVGQTSIGGAAPFSIMGRRYEAIGATRTLYPQFDIQRASVGGHLAGEAYRPDVSGDPWTLGGQAYLTVVWEHHPPGGNGDIVFRQLNADGTFVSTSPITLNSGPYDDRAPAISKSSGEGDYGIVWTQYNPFSTGGDIVGAVLNYLGGTVVPAFYIDSSSDDDTRPRISTPSRLGTPSAGNRTFMVTWQRNSDPFSNYGRLHCAAITTNPIQPLIQRWDLSALLGIPTSTWCYEPTVDCDGTRFAVAHGEVPAASPGTGHANLYVSTVAVDGAQLLVHESRAVLQNAGPQTFSPSLLSRYGGNLGNTRTYSIVGGTDAISVVGWIYNGHQPGSFWNVRPVSCGALPISYTGYPTLGDELRFDLGGTGPLRGFLFGFPTPATPIPGCASCAVGVTGGGNVPAPYVWNVPYVPGLVGLTLSVQGYGIGSGPCFGAIEISDIVDFTLR